MAGDNKILPQHQALLDASAISEEVARARGYWSATYSADLNGRFKGVQKRVPGLVIPVHNVVGELAFNQLRPDDPRELKGKPLKYETPAGARMVLDVPPATLQHLGNPKVTLWITEGIRKADSLVSAGLKAIALLGVWSWRGKNEHGGLLALADWHDIALNGRKVVLCFDSDAFQNEGVHQAVAALGRWLESRDAKPCFVYLPSDGAKVGVDDYLAAGHGKDELVALIEDCWRPLASEGGGRGSERRAIVQSPPGIASEPDILARFAADMRRLGHVGEEKASQLVYLSVTSRLLAKIVSVVIKGPSAAGKSATVDRVLTFFPAEAFLVLSGMSERYLVYDDTPIRHTMLILYEAAGMSGEFASYLIRTLLSEGSLKYGTVESTPNGLKPRMTERQGPTGLITTTTQVNLHAENETRLLSLPVDDTRLQTAAVMDAIASGAGKRVDVVDWHQLQCWLADGECRVVVPYAVKLAGLIPPLAVRLRRDFSSLLGLIRAHALLHRASRAVSEHGEIVASLDDYKAVRALTVELLSEGLGAQVSKVTRQTVAAVRALTGDEAGRYVTSAQLAKPLKVEPSAAYRRVKVAISQGYLVNDEDRQRRPMKLRVGEPLPEDQVILPEVETLADDCTIARHLDPLPTLDDEDTDDCTIARHSGDPHPLDDEDTLATLEEEELAERLLGPGTAA
jgi:hypothetical protein